MLPHNTATVLQLARHRQDEVARDVRGGNVRVSGRRRPRWRDRWR